MTVQNVLPYTPMQQCIHDHFGTLFGVDYTIEDDGIPNITSVRALDVTYTPAGPDLSRALGHMLVMTSPGVVDCFLSLVTESIHASRKIAGLGH